MPLPEIPISETDLIAASRRVSAAIAELNASIEDAHRIGLVVFMRETNMQTMGERFARYAYGATVMRRVP